MVYAATSTRDALQALEALYEREHDVDVLFNFGGSGALARQIVAGGQADVFLSADDAEMDKLAAAGLLRQDTRRALLSNQLVVVEPAGAQGSFAAPFDARQLAGPEVRLLSLADPASVPAGKYAKAWLESEGAWALVEARILPGVDARAALAAVESAGAQAGIVYRTDAGRSTKVRVVHAVTPAHGPRIVYPLAQLGASRREAADSFTAFLGSEEARAAFEAEGFIYLPATAGAAK